ncbi:MAG: hypothetical protein CM1200mP27_02920 [Chloroflexota bacterium]|nr:MAG: hypothetical protein CM1200mP27_02920 [Chloroflexota bacterium]
MRIITGFMPPTRGTVTLDGFDVVEQSLEGRRQGGLSPRDCSSIHRNVCERLPKIHGYLRGMPPKDIKGRLGDVIDVCRPGDYRKTPKREAFQRGFRQRVGIAQAILHQPQVLVLDEPTIGIDPIQVVETRRLIKDLGSEQTVVLSSHILPEVSMLCDRVLIINEGRIFAEDTPKNLAEGLQGVEQLEVEVGGPPAEVLPVLKAIRGVNEVNHINREAATPT